MVGLEVEVDCCVPGDWGTGGVGGGYGGGDGGGAGGVLPNSDEVAERAEDGD